MLQPFAEAIDYAHLNDSKRLSAKKRAILYDQLLQDKRITYATCVLSSKHVDEFNILEARKRALADAINKLSKLPQFVFVDGNFLLSRAHVPLDRQQAVVGADGKVSVVAAASIIAKQIRDNLMLHAHDKWPHYGFNQHKGYPTAAHIAALNRYGPCPIHRFSYKPVKYAAELHACAD